MKTTKLMLSAFVAALALVSCNKVETDGVERGSLKSVELSLSNVQFVTKAAGGSEITDGQSVMVSSFQVFFTDGTNVYSGKTETGAEIDAYYSADATSGTIAELNSAQAYHFLPDAVNKVIVVGNLPKIESPATLADINRAVYAKDQQDQTNLTLYAESSFTETGKHVENPDGHSAIVYTANCNLLPLIARLEVKSVGMTFGSTPKFDKVVFDKLIFSDYYGETNLMTGAKANLFSVDLTNDVTAFNYINSVTEGFWDNDALSLTALPTQTADQNAVTTNLSYSFFPNENVGPVLVLSAVATAAGSTTSAPAYVYTTQFKHGDNVLLPSAEDGHKGFKPGYIYRVESFNFSEDKLNHQEKCIDVKVTVDTWKVVAVTPVF